MPTYEYLCEECQYYFTKFCSISSMNDAESEECPNCNKIRIKKVMLSPPALGDSVRLGIRRPDDGFREVLQKIHESTPHSNVKHSSSYI